MNAAEACVHNLRTAMAVFLALRQNDSSFEWLHVSKTAYTKVRDELTERTDLVRWFSPGSVSFEFGDGTRLYHVNVTDRLSVINSHVQYARLKEKGFEWRDPETMPPLVEPKT